MELFFGLIVFSAVMIFLRWAYDHIREYQALRRKERIKHEIYVPNVRELASGSKHFFAYFI